jgi:hypothetical protein
MGHVQLGLPRRAGGGFSPALDGRHVPGSDALVGKMQNIADYVLGTSNNKASKRALERQGTGIMVWISIYTGIKILKYVSMQRIPVLTLHRRKYSLGLPVLFVLSVPVMRYRYPNCDVYLRI